MDQAADTIADRYQVQLSDSWTRWFDSISNGNLTQVLPLPGAFRLPVIPHDLAVDQPQNIWPGFMLPDTLPILGNEYGDWICVRVAEDNNFGELIHWYHGGGDWIPVGNTLAEAVLHDIVDQFRPVRQQMLRGAVETLSQNHLNSVLARFSNPRLHEWLVQDLPGEATSVADALETILGRLKAGEHESALEILLSQNWAFEAAACDSLEIALRKSVEPTRQEQAQAQVQSICLAVIERRKDLSWPFDVLGMQYENEGAASAAVETYFAGRHASSFTSQAVRLGNPSFDQRFGKFCIARLTSLGNKTSSALNRCDREIDADRYLQTILESKPEQVFNSVREYWISLARNESAAKDYASAHGAYFAAGWDLGSNRLETFQEILRELTKAANATGWKARAEVARTHASCLESRFNRRR